jgi:hypothetical protein
MLPGMRRDIELQAGAIDMASWLWDNRAQFLPLEIVRVDPKVIDKINGELAIELTVVLEDPADPDEGWPVGAFPALYEAALDRALAEYDSLLYIHPLARSSDEAA